MMTPSSSEQVVGSTTATTMGVATATATDLSDHDHHHDHQYTGAEAFLVGLSPSYWAHVPLCIAQIHNLHMIDGIQCMVDVDDNNSNDDAVAGKKLIPVSKCRVMGRIVHAERKSSGGAMYVLDDGTGLLDCVHWDCGDDKDLDGLTTGLPSLTGMPDTMTRSMFQPGDLVEVMGRIQCVKIDHVNVCTVNVLTADGSWKACRSSPAIRELFATRCERVTEASRAKPNSLDGESRHWMSCVNHMPRRNTLDVLDKLGSDISTQVTNRMNLPAKDDTTGAWRLFGSQCQCDLGEIQSELLYCHCIATAVPMDVEFHYRDTLLKELLALEKTCTEGHLRFLFREIVCNKRVQEVARQLNNDNHGKPLPRNTMAALRRDGIVYLIDEDSDTYLLVSKTGVLEPHAMRSLQCKDAEERKKFYFQQPAFLKNVPKARMQVVKRALLLKSNAMPDNVVKQDH